MGSGSRSGRQLLAVISLACAIGGLVLAAGALAPLASDSPASGIFEGATEGQTAGDAAAPSAAAAGGAGFDSSVPASGANSDLVGRLADNPLVGGVISNLLDGSMGGQSARSDGAGETESTTGSSDESGSSDDSSETGSTDGSGETGSTDGAGETGSAEGSDETGSTDRLEGSDSNEGGGGDSSLPDSVGGPSDRAVTAGLVALAALVVGYVFYTREDPIGTLLSIPGRLVSLALGAVVACSQALERALAALRGLRSIAELPGLVLAAISDAIRSARTRVRAFGSSVSTSLFGSGGDADGADAAVDTHTSARERIRQAFESVIDASPMYRTRVATATPADVARSATDAGAPDDPVETITRSFRDVEYGDRDPDAYLERTETAHDRLREAIEPNDDADVDAGGDSGE